ncbi:MAG: hypothetical protein JWO30_44 [Fibrobacteres bacterium]|nr:hypothetical protein [Fibrobacterota bacterium]
MAASWLPNNLNLSKLGLPTNLPPISFSLPPANPAPGTVNQPAPVAPTATKPSANIQGFAPAVTVPKVGSNPFNPLSPVAPTSKSSILNPFGSIPSIPGVSVSPGQTPPIAAIKPLAAPVPSFVPTSLPAPVMTMDTAPKPTGMVSMPPPITMDTGPKATGMTDTTPKAPPITMDYKPPVTPVGVTPEVKPPAPVVKMDAPVVATDSTKTGVTTENAPAPVTDPNAPPPPSPFNETLTKYMDTLNKWAEGMPDQQYKNALNQIITSSALMNSAETDALQMQINQDPNLRGQGAGLAMMQILARDHGFNLDQALAKASGDSLDRIISMQKYGIEGGTRLVTAMRDAKLQDAKIALDNAQLARDNQIEDAKILRDNTKSDINTLTSNGQFDAAAAAMNSYMKDAFPGLDLNITGASLKSRDPQELTKMTQKLSFIKDLIGKNPGAALPLIRTMMSDPTYDGYFPEGMTAEQVSSALATGQISENTVQANTLNTQINAFALPGANGKSQSFDETGNLYPELFRLQGRDAVKEGRKLDVADVNAIRAAEGLPAFAKDSQGNLVDENGVPLDDQDYTELAYRKDYYDKQRAASTKPWEQMRNQILDSPMGKYFTDESLYPGANDSLSKFLMAYSLSADAFTKDPQTREIVPNWDKLNLSLNSPEMWPIFHNWPTAVFGSDGAVMKDAAGKDISTPGGHVYGEIGPDGQPILSTPQDQALDSNYFAYRSSGGTLDPNQWYYATQGGKAQPDPTKIPAGLKNGEDFSKVGENLSMDLTPKNTGVTPGSSGDITKKFSDYVTATAGLTPDAAAEVTSWANTMNNAYANIPSGKMTKLTTGAGDDFDIGIDRLKARGIAQGTLDTFVSKDSIANGGTWANLTHMGGSHYEYLGTPEFATYTIYAKLLKSGMSETEAKAAFTTLVGKDRAAAALRLEDPNTAGYDKITADLNKVESKQ